MRVLMKIAIPMDKGNAGMKDRSLGKKMQAIVAEQKPEAAYFTTINGQRGAYIVVDMKDASEMVAYLEPWFLAFNATVETQPVMVAEDITKARPAIDQAVKEYA